MKSPFISRINFKWLFVGASFVAAVASSFAQTGPDLVNDDSDLFLANANNAAERPNVLIVLDNTANWNQAFTNEKAALVSVVQGLSDAYNVGLMMFPETGSPNDSVDGGYVRFGVRQMTATNKNALATMVGNLGINADKGNNATTGLAFYEAYLYFGAKPAVAGFGKIKRDFAGNTGANPLAASLPGNAFSSASSTTYASAISNNCQKNYIIYISNGPASENASARSQLQGYLTALKGGVAPTQISINPNGMQDNWVDELAEFMATNDVSSSASGDQNVISYTVEVDPGSAGQGPNMTALMKSTASKGKGKYIAVTSAGGGTSIVAALNAIFSEIQSVNSVFAAASLPVSANVRGTNLNQVYVGVFRPDAKRLPRWDGNLKMYKFAINSATNSVFLADANGVPAENQATGFIANTATSLWTSSSSFWSYRSPYPATDVGGASDGPDGDLVEKGGAAQRLRVKYALGQASNPLRGMYTCTTGTVNCQPACVDGTCSGGSTAVTGFGSLLSTTPFSSTNTDLTPDLFNLNTQFVSPLTAALTKSISSIQDQLTITSLTNTGAGSNVAVTLNNGASVITVSTMVNNLPTATVTSFVPTASATVTAVSYTGGNPKFSTYTANNNFVAGDTVWIAGTTNFNGSKVVSATSLSATSFRVDETKTGNPNPETALTTAFAFNRGVLATTSANHGFTNGQNVTITSANTTYGSGATYAILEIRSPTKFVYQLAAPPQVASTTGSAQSSVLTASATTSANHGFVNGASITITGADQAQYNGTFVISGASGSSFMYNLPSLPSGNATGTIKASGPGTTTVVATGAGTGGGFIAGATVTIAGAAPAAYNGSYLITANTANTFTFSTSTGLGAASGSIVASVGAATNTATAVTSLPHGLAVGNTFVIAGVTGTTPVAATGYNGPTWTVLSTPSATSLTFSTLAQVFGVAGGSPVLRGVTPKVWVNSPAHGYASAQQVTIEGVTPAAYNGAFTVTVIDANTFTYGLGAQPGTASGTATASTPTTTARATSVNHGFSTNDSVTISGATPSAFNGSGKVVTVLDANTFTYTLGPAQLHATGTIKAFISGGTGGGLANLINWIRGQDNAEDENANASTTDVRASIHGDVLHSRPLVVNYNRGGSFPSGDNDVVIFYGTNGGAIHAVQGGAPPTPGADPHGNELWSFVPPEFFPNLNRLRNNSPKVSSSFKRSYFGDGSFTAYVKNVGDLTKLGESGDIVYIYATFRRGGRMLYAFDVSDPATPRIRWKIDPSSIGFSQLGETWSKPVLIPQINGHSNPVLLFGAGWDPAVEDINPLEVASVSSLGNVTKTDGSTVNRSMGRGVYMVDAITGELIWRVRRNTTDTTLDCQDGTPAFCRVPDMNFAIPSDPIVVRNSSGGLPGRAYVGDTGGQMWRLDFASSNKANWTVTKIASIADQSVPAGRRKFLYAPEVVSQSGFDAILIGTGDREHPFDTTVQNRMYMFKDLGNDSGPQTGVVGNSSPTIVPSALYNATPVSGSSAVNATALAASQGWYVALGTGEKLTGGAIAVFGSVFFGTNQPDSAAGGGSCGANLGIARIYQVGVADAAATGVPVGSSATATISTIVPGGGFLPPPAFGIPNIPNTNPDGSACATCGSTPTTVMCFGVKCIEPGSVKMGSRIRRYWYKDISE